MSGPQQGDFGGPDTRLFWQQQQRIKSELNDLRISLEIMQEIHPAIREIYRLLDKTFIEVSMLQLKDFKKGG
jgi:hypothetical protein